MQYKRVLGVALLVVCAVIAQEAATTQQSPLYSAVSPKGSFYFFENFDEHWEHKWASSSNEKYSGVWEVQEGKEPQGLIGDKALTITTAARHYAISSKFDKVLDNTDKDLVIQYEVRLQDGLTCGGAYMKLYAEGLEPKEMVDSSPYVIMFGPDKCGSESKVHFIFRHQNPLTGVFQEKHMTKRPTIKSDKLSHLYTLHIMKDNTFKLYIDQEVAREGSLLSDFDPSVIPPTEIDDPEDKKPADWVDIAKIPDSTAVKPEGWDDIPEEIPDPDAVKPEDWNDEEDGEWVAPTISNPEYKGEWEPPMIPNPEYKGEWKPKQIPNPNYFEDLHPHNFKPIHGLGFELWTMSAGISFDNILVTDDKKVADDLAAATWKPKFEEQSRIQKIKEEEARKAVEPNPYQEYIDTALAFAKENQMLVVGTVAIGTIVPILACFLMAGGEKKPKPQAQPQPTEPKKESKEEKAPSSSPKPKPRKDD